MELFQFFFLVMIGVVLIIGWLVWHAPLVLSKGVLAILSLLLMALGFWLAPQQLSSLGLAARNKEPDQLAYYLSIGQGVAGFLNLIPLAVSTKRVALYLAYLRATAACPLSLFCDLVTFQRRPSAGRGSGTRLA
jgi:hypothetical protein